MKAQTKKEYKEAWDNHIDVLNSVRFDLIANKECDEMERLMDRMKEIINVAAENIEL